MINLETNGLLARWFVWSCDYLPFTVTHYCTEEDGKKVEHRRTGSHYVVSGTTLCHIFWAILWVPLLATGFATLLICMFVFMHLAVHSDYMRSNPDAGPIASVASYFMVEGLMAAMALGAGLITLAIFGGSKTGFFTLLWQYLKGFKQRICPLVRFDLRT